MGAKDDEGKLVERPIWSEIVGRVGVVCSWYSDLDGFGVAFIVDLVWTDLFFVLLKERVSAVLERPNRGFDSEGIAVLIVRRMIEFYFYLVAWVFTVDLSKNWVIVSMRDL